MKKTSLLLLALIASLGCDATPPADAPTAAAPDPAPTSTTTLSTGDRALLAEYGLALVDAHLASQPRPIKPSPDGPVLGDPSPDEPVLGDPSPDAPSPDEPGRDAPSLEEPRPDAPGLGDSKPRDSKPVKPDTVKPDAGTAEPVAPAVASGFEYEQVFVSIYVDGRLRGCQSGDEGKLVDDVRSATLLAIKDKRFGGPMTPDEAPRADINLTFLHDRQTLVVPQGVDEEAARARGEAILKAFEPGIHAIEVREGDKRAFFKADVPITKNYTAQKTLRRLCKKARLGKDCHERAGVEVNLYRALTFHKPRGGEVFEQVRANPAVDPALTEALVRRRLELGLGWFKSNIDPKTGRLRYEYMPSEDAYSDDNNDVRQLASVWSITEIMAHLKAPEDAALAAAVDKTLDLYLSEAHLVRRPASAEASGPAAARGDAFITVDGKAKLAYNAFAILALLGRPSYPDGVAIMGELARGILKQQRASGEFATHFESDKNTGVEFYPGEAMLALMRLHRKTGDVALLKAVQRAFPHYRDYWRANKNTPMLSWHSQTYRLLFEATKDPEVAAHTFEMNDWLIDSQITEGPWPDKIGGFGRGRQPTIASATYLEGLHDAFAVASQAGDEARAARYKAAILRGVGFVLRLQFTEANSFHLKNPALARGGFRHSLVENNLRNDNTQHAALMLIKTLEINILDDNL